MIEVQAVDVRAGYALGTWDCVNVLVLRQGVSLDALAALRECTRELSSEYDGVATITMAPRGMNMPDRAVCAEAARLAVEVQDELVCSVTVLEGRSLWSTAARATIFAIQHLSRHVLPLVVCDNTGDAVSWIAPQVGQPTIWADALAEGVSAFAHEHMPAVKVAAPTAPLNPVLETLLPSTYPR